MLPTGTAHASSWCRDHGETARQRKKTSLPARFGAERPEQLGLITDVSARGVYLSTNSVLSQGVGRAVQVKVPGGDRLLQGRVMRTRRVARRWS